MVVAYDKNVPTKSQTKQDYTYTNMQIRKNDIELDVIN